MAQHASEIDESTASEGLHCQQCGDAIPGEPFYPFRDVVRTDGEFTYTEDADGPFCDVTCLRGYDTAARAE